MKKLSFLFLTLLCSILSVSMLFSQSLDISGTVTESVTGDGLPGANISIKGTNLGTATDSNGNFSLSLPNFTQATLEVSFIGYITSQVAVTQSTSSLNIALDEDVLKVSEIVVTGLATSVKRRNLANSVGTVSSKELLVAPAQTLERALNGKMAGLTISQNTGAPGGGINVNLRGTSTILGDTQPLFVVDGVIISDFAIQSGIDVVSQATGAGSARPQGQPSNRIADLNPNDIQNIEVLKGPSASAIYGSKATNGVVIITTKSGTAGKPRVDVTQQIGFSSILNKIGTRTFTAATALEFKGQEGADFFAQNGNIDQEDVLYGEKGFLTETTLSVRGGSERTQFYISGLIQDEDGIVKNTGYQKLSGRLNVDHKISERIKISAYSNFARSESDRGLTGNANVTTATFGFALANTPGFVNLDPDENGVYPDHPYNQSNPVQTRDLITNRETVNRTLTSLKLDWDILRSQNQSLDFIAQAGVDFFSMVNRIHSPNELQFERDSAFPGTAGNGETKSTFSNVGLNLTHSYTTAGNIVFRSTGGLQFENRNVNSVNIFGNGLPPGQTAVDLATSINVLEQTDKQRERGFFFQEEIDLDEKIYLTGAVRGDASSANGDVDKYFLFPKVSGSIRLSQFGFWEGLSNLSSEFKLRAAYGQTGNLPKPNDKFTNASLQIIGGLPGFLPSGRISDPNIKPERTKELELGIDATIFNGNGTLELTYYRQNVSDLILAVALPPSSGNIDAIFNAGEMRTTGFEASLGLTPIRSKNLSWTSRINFFTTDSEITELGVNPFTGLPVDPFNTGGFATFLGAMRIQKGFSPNTIIGSETVINADGTIDNILGNEIPDFTVGFNNNFTFGSFNFSFLWDWSQGGEVVDLGLLLTDLGGTSGDYDEIVTFNLPDGSSVTGRAGEERLNVLGTITAPYVSDATYLKLRELSLSYSVPSSVVNNLFNGQISYLRLGVAARNLIMISDYSGYDPEVSQFGNLAVGRAIDTLPFPSSRQFYFNVAFGL